MTNNNEEAASRAILAQFAARWQEEEAKRRLRLLAEAIPRIPTYTAALFNQKDGKNIHPEHLECYIAYLQPRVRAVIEFVSPQVIDKILNSHSADERLAKIIRLVDLMDRKAAESQKNSEPPKE